MSGHYTGPDHQLEGRKPPLALLERENLVRSFMDISEVFCQPQIRYDEHGAPHSIVCRDPKHYRSSAGADPIPASASRSNPSSKVRQIKPLVHPTSLHRAVNDLYKVLVREVVADEKLVVASLVVHRADFGLVVYKHPAPGMVHVYNRRFGSRPILLCEEPLEVGSLQAASGEFV